MSDNNQDAILPVRTHRWPEAIALAIVAVAAVAALYYHGAHRLEQTGSDESVPAAQVAAAPAKGAGELLEPVSASDRKIATELVHKISDNKASVKEVFKGASNMIGVVVSANGTDWIGWMPASRDALIVGAMFDTSGRNLTQAEMVRRGYATAGAAPSQTDIERAVEQTAGFVEGSNGPLLIAFVDFNCGFCKEFFHRSRALVAQGALRVRWVPVAILAEDSLAKAAAVLDHPMPVKAITLQEEGALPAAAKVSKATSERIGANTAVLNLLSGGQPGTPTLIVRDANGTYRMSPGVPPNLSQFITGK